MASREEGVSIYREWHAAMIKKRMFEETRKKEHEDEMERLWKNHAKDHPDPQVTPFNEKPFGEVMVYACSGTAVLYLNDKIRPHHTIFVTTKCLAHSFESNRTRDDKLMVRVRLPNKEIISGFMGLYDENIAIVTAFTLAHVYPVNTEPDVDRLPNTDSPNLYALGRTYGGDLMGAKCYSPSYCAEAGVLSCCGVIMQAGLGGPVIERDQNGDEHFVGMMVEVPEAEATVVKVSVKFLPTKLVHQALQRFAQLVTETTYFRGYSLPKGIKSVLPTGFKLRSLLLKSLGYPLPPPLVFELCGSLVGTFEEMFGELHACEGFPWDYGPKPIWERLGKNVVQNLSRCVVSVSSFHGDTRFFACTGFLVASTNGKFVLTSASLFRTGDVDDKIDLTLSIEVFISQEEHLSGRLVMYHQGYNIAIVSLSNDLGAVFAQDIFKVPKSKSREVAAIGRPTKEHEGLLMAAKGNLKCRRKKDKLGSEIKCKDLKLTTCEIKKVGIGGPLIRFEDGSFIGMNFYNESGPTPYLPRSKIVEVLKRGFNRLSRRELAHPISLDMETEGDAAKKNRWHVPKPYWYLAGNGNALDHIVGKVRM